MSRLQAAQVWHLELRRRLGSKRLRVHAAADLGIHGHRLYFISDTVP